MDAEVSTHTFLTMIIEESVCFQIIVFPDSNANDMHVTQDLNSFREIIAHAHCSVDDN
jgi:hypothetical protein